MTRQRLVYVAAAALALGALVLPLWGFSMSAPQYPDETLHLQVTRGGIAGDVHEVETLQHYIGVRFPETLPELRWATSGIVAVSALLLVAAFAGSGRVSHAYRLLCAVAVLVFLIGSAVVVQRRLYVVGHQRAPNAPIRAVHDFTPPLIGPVKVGNFTVWSYPHFGALLLLGAAALTILGVRVNPSRGVTGTGGSRARARRPGATVSGDGTVTAPPLTGKTIDPVPPKAVA